MTIKDALENSKAFRDMYDADERYRKVIDTARAIEDMPKDTGTHAAGIVITKNPVVSYVPLALSKKDNTIATQYVMTGLPRSAKSDDTRRRGENYTQNRSGF